MARNGTLARKKGDKIAQLLYATAFQAETSEEQTRY